MNVIKIRSFLGLVGYFWRFIVGFSRIVGLLTKLTQNYAKFKWSDECENNFQELNNRLVSALVLTLLSGLGGFLFIVMLH